MQICVLVLDPTRDLGLNLTSAVLVMQSSRKLLWLQVSLTELHVWKAAPGQRVSIEDILGQHSEVPKRVAGQFT